MDACVLSIAARASEARKGRVLSGGLRWAAHGVPVVQMTYLSLRVRVCFVCRLVSGNSIEEKLLKNGTKDLIREVAAQGNDYSMAFLTQVPCLQGPRGGLPHGAGHRHP